MVSICRRRFLHALPVSFAAIAGCFGEETSGGFSSDGGSGETDTDPSTPQNDQIVAALRDSFEDRGLEVLDISTGDTTIEIGVQTTGNLDEDVRHAAGAYATFAASLERNLFVRVEDRGLVQETFEIKLEWARQFADDRMGSQEYLDRINETRVEQ